MKLAINILVHHKPWLIESSLISLFNQTDLNFELNIIHIKGDGNSNDKFLQDYNKFSSNQKNEQLTDSDPKILEILKKIKFSYNIFSYQNNHGLDSGAWIKFIKSKFWEKYDYNFFLMEGFIFTQNTFIEDFKSFANFNKPDFIGTGFEKRYLPLQNFLNSMKDTNNKIDEYHNKCINQIFDDFCVSEKFKNIYEDWSNYSIRNNKGYTQYFIPMKLFSNYRKIKLYLKHIYYKNKIYLPYEHSILICDEDNSFYTLPVVNLNIKTQRFGKTNFHIDNSFVFSCMCQHIFSKKFLEQLYLFFKQNDLFNIYLKPFSATSLEPIWALYPKIFGFDKWFFDGIYRPRKDFFSYRRIDVNVDDISLIFNKFHSEVKTKNVKNSIKITSYNPKLINKFEYLDKFFFYDRS